MHQHFPTGNAQYFVVRKNNMAISECPSCTYHIALPSNLEEGSVLQCPDCGEMLKLVSIFPPIFEQMKEE